MTNLDTGVTGAKRQSFKRASPRDLLKRLIEENAHAEESELQKTFAKLVLEDDTEDYLASIIEYWFANNYRSLVHERRRPRAETPAIKAAKEKLVGEVKRKIEKRIHEEAAIILLDVMLPHGKALRDSTGKECAKLGGWFGRIAEQVKPGQIVGKVLSEDQVRKLYGAADK